MAEKNFNTRMQQKIDTTENWGKAVNFVPKKGEIIVYSDGGGVGIPKIKVGDGTTKVGNLKFITIDSNADLSINGNTYNGSSAVSLSSQQLGVPSAFIAKSVSVLDCNSEKIGRVLSSSADNTLVNGPTEIGSTGAGVLWNIPALSAPTSSINEAGTQQKLYQIFVYDSGKVYLRKNSSNDTATWTYGTWEKLLTDVNITADNITTALGYTPVKDVQVAGRSVLDGGVANVPIAQEDAPGVVSILSPQDSGIWNDNGSLKVSYATDAEISGRTGTRKAIVCANLDYAVKAAMCDGKGAAWTSAEQKAARERMGIPGDYELIEEIVLTEESRVARSKEPDGAPYNFATIMMRAEFPASDKTGNIFISYNIGNEYNNIISYFVSPYKAYAVKYGYSKVWVENSRYRSGWWTCVENHGQFAQYYENPMQQDKYSIADGNIIGFSTDVMAAGTKITIYGVRA